MRTYPLTSVLYIAFFSIIFFTAVPLHAQSGEIDVIYLKNGTSITGTILEKVEGKTVVIQTKEGVEFYDYIDIKEITKEFVPEVSSFTPSSTSAGTIISLNGTFPARQPASSSVFIGNAQAKIVQWSSSRINVKIPEIDPGQYSITLTVGKQKDISPRKINVTAPLDEEPVTAQSSRRSVPTVDSYNLSGFLLNFGYAIPTGEFKETNGKNAGFAKSGLSFGYEGRVGLSDNFFVPISFQLAYLGLNLDEMNKLSSVQYSSDDKAYYSMWITAGLGMAINLSPSSYLFASGEYGVSVYHRPDLSITSFNFNAASAESFSPGYCYSFGLTFTDAVTFGAKFYNAKPKYSVSTSVGSGSSSGETEIEQPSNFVIYCMAVAID